jgi:periplasmic copper chaperone A
MTFLTTTRSLTLALFALAVICAGPAVAQQLKAGDLVLDHAWARATPGGAEVGGAYLTIKNNGTAADKLIGGSSSIAAEVQVHEMAMNNGVMTMRPVNGGLSIPPGKSVTLAPGGYHIMLMQLKAPLKQGGKLPVTLQFEKAGKVDVTFDIEGVGASAPPAGQMDHAMPGMQEPMQMKPGQKM